MFYYLEGIVAHTEPFVAVIDCGGVGYLCHVTTQTQSKLKLGQKARLYTHLNVREDAMEIYGFADMEEKNCFMQLTSISGVGVKVAISILSTVSPERFALAVLTDDIKLITNAPGVGKKLAQRIILELKDKMKKQRADKPEITLDIPDIEPVAGNTTDEARMALQVLGYSAAEASAALRGVDAAGKSVEDIIKIALRNLAK